MRIAIIGAGAVGGLLGGLLSRAGHAVSFVAQKESLEAIRSRGLVITTPSERFETGPLPASPVPDELGASDLLIIAVKAWQVEALAPKLKVLLGPATMVVPTQNGVEAAEHLEHALGKDAVLGGICRVLATRLGPGRVQFQGPTPHLTLGERASGTSKRLEQLAGALRAAGIAVTLSSDIHAELWSKLLFIEPLGGMGAVTRSSIDVVRSIPETRSMLELAMREVEAVGAANGARLPDDTIPRSLALVDAMPRGSTTSMQRDLVEGRPSELSEQTGAVVRFGKQAGVPRPVHDFLFASLLPQDCRLSAAR
jgi:2-dehydropantoate 2-reductase